MNHRLNGLPKVIPSATGCSENPVTMTYSRRQILARTLGSIGLIGSSNLIATPDDLAAALQAIAGDSEIEQGALKLTLPAIAENGHSVPVSVSVDMDIDEKRYVESIVILASENPNLTVLSFNFSAASGEVFAATRMRLAKTQDVVAVAKLSDGSVISDTQFVNVTVGGCGA